MHVSVDSFFLNDSESGLIGTSRFGLVDRGGDSMAYSMIDAELIMPFRVRRRAVSERAARSPDGRWLMGRIEFGRFVEFGDFVVLIDGCTMLRYRARPFVRQCHLVRFARFRVVVGDWGNYFG